MMNNKSFPLLYDQIISLLEPFQAYLVGGAVRDLLLGRPIHDLDFALPEDTVPAAKLVADQLGGVFYVLDPDRETARTILEDQNGQRLMVDFTRFQGRDIEADLGARDFTVTSMALKPGPDQQVIDPFHGAQDLKDRYLRLTSATSLADDPLRCLRAVRLAAQFRLRIAPETKDQIRHNAPGMATISPERIRDELFRLLEGPKQSAAFQALEILGLSPYVFGGAVTEDQINTLRNLEDLWGLFQNDHDQYRAANWYLGLVVHRLGRYRANLQSYLRDELVPGRTIYQLSLITALLPGNENLRQTLPLSNQEWDFLEDSAGAAAAVLAAHGGAAAEPLDIYRFYRQFGSAGVAGVYLFLAKAGLDQQETLQDEWIAILDTARVYLEGWWEKQDVWVKPPVLLNGDDLQREFNLLPGPQIGLLLESLREGQVERGISSREEAILYLMNQVDQSSELSG
jgi:hypothetical protein